MDEKTKKNIIFYAVALIIGIIILVVFPFFIVMEVNGGLFRNLL